METAAIVAFTMIALIFFLNIGLLATDIWADSRTGGTLDILPGDSGLGQFTYADLNSMVDTAATYGGCNAGDWICSTVQGISSVINDATFGIAQFGAFMIWLVALLPKMAIGFHLAIMLIAGKITDAAVLMLLYGIDAVIFIAYLFAIIYGVFVVIASILRGGGG